MADAICVTGCSKHPNLFSINYSLTLLPTWNSKLIQELLAGRVDHMVSPGFEH